MKPLSFLSKPLVAAALGLLALGASTASHAGADVHFSIGFPAPVYVAPAPVYVQPQPVYVQPRPVYVQPQPVYVQPQPVYVQPPHRHGWNGPRHHWRHAQHHGHGGRGDWDRDGVPNRHDRFPGNQYRY